MIQNFINMIVNWFYSYDIVKFDQEYKNITTSQQFPSEEVISKRLDFAMNNFHGNKISADFSQDQDNVVEVVGTSNSTN